MKNTRIKSWYLENYPTDELGERIKGNVTFSSLIMSMENGEDFYCKIGVSDSVIRERVFHKLSELFTNGDYNKIYNLWLLR